MKFTSRRIEIRRITFAAGLCFVCCVASASGEYGPFTVGGQTVCTNDRSGLEQSHTYAAPAEQFFVANSINVRETTGIGPAHSCAVSGTRTRHIKATTEFGEVDQEVISEFTVLARATCEAGRANASGATAAVECTVSAGLQDDSQMQETIKTLLLRLPDLSSKAN